MNELGQLLETEKNFNAWREKQNQMFPKTKYISFFYIDERQYVNLIADKYELWDHF